MYLLKIIKEAISIYEKNILIETKNFYTKITKEISKLSVTVACQLKNIKNLIKSNYTLDNWVMDQ